MHGKLMRQTQVHSLREAESVQEWKVRTDFTYEALYSIV